MADSPTTPPAAVPNLYPTGTIFSDSQFQDQVAQATARQQLAQNRAGEDWATQQYNYGLGVGAANPFGQQQLLNRNQKIEATDAKNSFASRPGGVRSGAYRIANANLTFNQLQGQNALQQSFLQAQTAYNRAKEDINSSYASDIYNAGLGSVQRKLDADAAANLGGNVDTGAQQSGAQQWAKATALYSTGKWASGPPAADGSRLYTAKDGKTYKVWPSGRRELVSGASKSTSSGWKKAQLVSDKLGKVG